MIASHIQATVESQFQRGPRREDELNKYRHDYVTEMRDCQPGYRERYRLLQRNLKFLNFYKGPIDGIPGSGTQRAVTAFADRHGLPFDISIDDDRLLFAIASEMATRLPV